MTQPSRTEVMRTRESFALVAASKASQSPSQKSNWRYSAVVQDEGGTEDCAREADLEVEQAQKENAASIARAANFERRANWFKGTPEPVEQHAMAQRPCFDDYQRMGAGGGSMPGVCIVCRMHPSLVKRPGGKATRCMPSDAAVHRMRRALVPQTTQQLERNCGARGLTPLPGAGGSGRRSRVGASASVHRREW